MARVSGTEISTDFLGSLERDAVKRIVMAGAEALVEETRREIDQYHHVVTGSMRDNVQATGYREWMGGGAAEVYPQGADSRGNDDAQKAFIIDRGIGRKPTTKRSHGKQRNKTGGHFLTQKTRKEAEEVTVRAMEAEYDRIIAEINE